MDQREDQVELQTVSIKTVLGIRITAAVKILFFVIVLFCLPLFLSGPQLLIWSIVNLLLIWAARKLSRSKARPLAFVPSIAAVLHGVIFWPFTIFLIYMMPAIRLGNLALMYIISHVSHKPLAVLIWWIAKAWLLFFVAYVLIQNGFLPNIFLEAMGIIQLVTALIGWVTVFGFIKLFK